MEKKDYAGDLLAACCGTALHLWRPTLGGDSEDKVVPSDRTVLAAAWNRNNKVVASAREDGAIELRYSNGTLMTILHRTGTQPATSLAWSMGSKRLAAASRDGNVYLHDMTAKTCTPLASPATAPAPISAVAFHPDDRFLATAGTSLSLHSVQTPTPLGNLSLNNKNTNNTPVNCTINDDDPFTCLGVAAGQPCISAGTSSGCVAVWDYKTKQLLHADASRHLGGTTAVQFAPLDPSVLYSIGKDGALLMQDLRAGLFHVPTARIGAGVPLTSLSIREDFAHLAAGTVDGKILLYDPRYCGAPAETLRCGDAAPVTSLHWQHTYQSVSVKAKEAAAAAAVVEGTFPAGRLSMMAAGSFNSSSNCSSGEEKGEEGRNNGNENKSRRVSFPFLENGGGGGGGATMKDAHRFQKIHEEEVVAAEEGEEKGNHPHKKEGRQSFTSFGGGVGQFEPPRKLDLSPLVSLRTSLPSNTTTAAAVSGVRRLSEHQQQRGDGSNGATAAVVPTETTAAMLARFRRESIATTTNTTTSLAQKNRHTTTTTAAAVPLKESTTMASPSSSSSLSAAAVSVDAQRQPVQSHSLSFRHAAAAVTSRPTPPTEASSAHMLNRLQQQQQQQQQQIHDGGGGETTAAEREEENVAGSAAADTRRETQQQQQQQQYEQQQHGYESSSWSIKATTPQQQQQHCSTRNQPGTAAIADPVHDYHHPSDNSTQRRRREEADDLSRRQNQTAAPSSPPFGYSHLPLSRASPSKVPLTQLTRPEKTSLTGTTAKTTTTTTTATAPLPESHGETTTSIQECDAHSLHQDILAMHLDMLNQFREQQEASAALVAGLTSKQEALAAEVTELRRELRDLLSRRDGALWL